jgi:predicted phosphoribosyltransferase
MMFTNRRTAGEKLAERLAAYEGAEGVIVVALPRGGVDTGRAVADALGAPLDIVVPRKVGAQGNPEYAVGAITETGHAVWNEEERRRADPAYLEKTMEAEKAEAKRRLETYRAGMPPRDLRGKTVILVDDGIATGLTMRAAVETVRSEGPSRVIVAAPVAPPESVEELASLVDEVVVLEKPPLFFAIGAFYADFDQVNDDDVIRLMRSAKSGPAS